MLASGADDSLVLIWDLINQNVSSITPNGAQHGHSANDNGRSPAASWRCDYEISNISWAPPSGLSSQGGEWVGVCGGRGVWGVRL
jgi:WD repeat-containing protein 68